MEVPVIKFLEGDKIYLRPLSPQDANGNYPAWLNHATACFGNSHHVFPYSREAALEYIADARKGGDKLILAIALQETDEHIGNIALHAIHPVYRSAEFSILIGEQKAWGKGYGLEAIALLMTHAFNNLNLRRISCGTFSNNYAMQKIALNLGMQEEGMRRQAAFKEGRYLDVKEYGVFAEEFFARQQLKTQTQP